VEGGFCFAENSEFPYVVVFFVLSNFFSKFFIRTGFISASRIGIVLVNLFVNGAWNIASQTFPHLCPT
jgi:hypothetical protein